jgi:hypothetical protein
MIRLVLLLISVEVFAQDEWTIEGQNINPNNYYGVTVANGMVGIVSSAEPLKVKDVVLNGVYDYYQRGRVSNILKTFNHVNMNLDVDGRRMTSADVSNYTQVVNMKKQSSPLHSMYPINYREARINVAQAPPFHGADDNFDNGQERRVHHADECN